MKKKNIKKIIIISMLYLIGILVVLLMCKNAERIDKQHTEQNQTYYIDKK